MSATFQQAVDNNFSSAKWQSVVLNENDVVDFGKVI